jgi:hypothetical protein
LSSIRFAFFEKHSEPMDQRKATDISHRAIHAPLTESAVSLNSLTGGTTHWIGMMPNAKVYYAAACEVIG